MYTKHDCREALELVKVAMDERDIKHELFTNDLAVRREELRKEKSAGATLPDIAYQLASRGPGSGDATIGNTADEILKQLTRTGPSYRPTIKDQLDGIKTKLKEQDRGSSMELPLWLGRVESSPPRTDKTDRFTVELPGRQTYIPGVGAYAASGLSGALGGAGVSHLLGASKVKGAVAGGISMPVLLALSQYFKGNRMF